jgi:enediyne biosynthesis protein E4
MAVVSQPFDRKCKIPAPGKPDPSLKEWWVENPWDIVKEGRNLSCYERKRTYLNVGGSNFLDVSYLSGADNDGDGRAVVAGDFRNNGRLDLVVRQIGGGPLLLYENNFPQRHYLKVTLRGKPEAGKGPTSNRQGIGARVIAELEVKGHKRQIVREMYPFNSFRSQAPNIIHFGLGDENKVERLVIRWPSGREQVLTNVPADKHILVEEGNEAFEEIKPGPIIQP